MLDKVAVIGAGSWGTTVAALAASLGADRAVGPPTGAGRRLEETHENPDYLPGVVLPETLRATSSLEDAVSGSALVVMAVPSHGFRTVLSELAPYLPAGTPVLSLAKGLEQGTHLRMTEVIAEVGSGPTRRRAHGPNLAREIAAGQPAATVVAMTDESLARSIQEVLRTQTFRVYTNPDVVGCEMAGATKNVLAIAAGILQGLGLGDSSLAALITRGLAELGRLGVAMGGERITIAGLAGVGDLVATCTSTLSRNRMVGEQLGQGSSLERDHGGHAHGGRRGEDGAPAARAGRRPRRGDAHRGAGGRRCSRGPPRRRRPSAPSCPARPSPSSTVSAA